MYQIIMKLNNYYDFDKLLLEMADNRREFIKQCINFAKQIHFNIINIIILGDLMPENINHWKSELLNNYIKPLLSYNKIQQNKKIDILYEN